MENDTVAQNFKDDPVFLDSREKLLQALKVHQDKITGIRPPRKELADHYQKILETYAEQRAGKLWYPYLGSGIGRGPFVELLDGSVKYDFIGGIGVHHFGHSHPEIIATSIDAALSDIVMQGGLQQNYDAVELTDLLIKESELDHCMLTTSGAMANENAFKIALQKNYPASRILAFDNSFTGRTWTMAQVGDRPIHREGLPLNVPVDYIPFYNPADPEGSTQASVDGLKKHLARYPKHHALMILELVQGEGGCIPGTSDYFKKLMKILKEHHVAIIIDEIQTLGRTSRLFAFQHFGLEEYADIVTIGKLSQICATLYKKEWKPAPGLLAQTFLSSSVAIQTGKKILHMLLDGGYFGPEGKNMQIHSRFVKNFEEILKKHPGTLRGPYGIGGMIVFIPFDGSMARVKELGQKLFEKGVITFIAGQNPVKIRMLPPLGAISEQDIDNVCKIIEETLCL